MTIEPEACSCPGSTPLTLEPYVLHGATLPSCGLCGVLRRVLARDPVTGEHVCRPCVVGAE